MGLRFLIFLAAIWIILLIIRFYYRSTYKNKDGQRKTPIDTVRCKKCGLALPKNEAIARNNHFFCSEKHADRDS